MPSEPIPDRGPDEEPDDCSPPGEEWDGPEQGLFVCLPAEELTLEGFAEDGRADTKSVTERLPRTFAALFAGRIHPVHLQIIDDETRVLKPEDAARADEILSQQAPSQTFAKLRSTAHRVVLKLDPEAAQRRKEAARRETHVRPFREASGNAGMIAREMPSDEVLASWQHVEQRALDLRAAGVPGTLRELRFQAYLDLLQERDSRTALADPAVNGDLDGNADPARNDGPGADPDGNDGPSAGPDRPGGTGPNGTGRPAQPDPGPSLAAQVTITVPLAAWDGDPGACGEADGFGLVDAEDARALVAAAL